MVGIDRRWLVFGQFRSTDAPDTTGKTPPGERSIMREDTEDESPKRGDSYRHSPERVEIVFERAGGRVLTVTEYATEAAFREAVEEAAYDGTHQGVLDLPPVESFDPEE
jgi:8-oxo-dGTP pyrophosphatase MutT (NUDIX family)